MRLFLIHQPMGHDESYTSVIFAFEPLYKGLSDYHFPNNHVFHTFLVHIAYRLFGAQEWAVRFPALISGVLLIPAGFVLAKAWYGRKTAALTALMIAVFPELINYSVNARGYSLMALLTLLLFICGTYAKNHRNSAAWFLVGFFGALGFYTLPTMAYPLIVLFVWLGLSWLISDYNIEYHKAEFLGYLFFSGIFTLVLGFALYIPIFKNWGIKSVLANDYTQALSQAIFWPTLQSRLTDTWNMLNQGEIPFIGLLLLIGVLLSFLQFQKIGKDRIPLQITSIIVIGILIAIQRPNVYYRTWIFYIPLLCIWSSAGWFVTIKSIFHDKPESGKLKFSLFLTFCLGFIFLLNGLIFTVKLIPSSQNARGDVEKATLFLKDQLNEDDIVVITANNDARMWFYFEKYGLGRGYFSRVKPFKNAYVVVTNNTDQTIQSVIKERGPDLVFFDMDSVKKIEQLNTLDIYLIKANTEAVQKAYGDWKK
ncbi:MAG: glycosyltransferase family 39 protein [Anaerolineaceae bacterium]